MKRALLAGGLLVILVIGLQPVQNPASPPRPGRGDLAFHRAVVERLRSGESYYQATAAELRARHYPMRSVFNWRPPLLSSVLAQAPERVGAWLLVAFSVALCILTATSGTREAPLAAVLVLGTVLLPSQFHESWSGTLLGLSAVAYIRGWPITGALAAAVALFVRELAAPYVVACALLALKDRRVRELALWLIVLLGYGFYFWRHAANVAAHGLPSDPAQSGSWLQFGGIPFLVSVIHVSSWLPLLPRAASAVVLALLCCVTLSHRTPTILRAALVAYGAFFSVVGQPFNWYWGLMVGPMCAVALGYAPAALISLFRPPDVGSSHAVKMVGDL